MNTNAFKFMENNGIFKIYTFDGTKKVIYKNEEAIFFTKNNQNKEIKNIHKIPKNYEPVFLKTLNDFYHFKNKTK